MPLPPEPAARSLAVKRLVERQGFAICGFAPALPPERGGAMLQWLAQGRHGEMGYLAEHVSVRLDPRELLPGARTVVCVADRYHADVPHSPLPGVVGESRVHRLPTGRVARYAWGDDYHRVIRRRLHAVCDALRLLFPGESFRTTVDTAPLLERPIAQSAGLGWVGKHTLLIHPRLGSWMLLGEVLTTLRLQWADELAGADQPGGVMTDHCGQCTRCIDACPTRCIDPAGYALDATRCVSYLTIEHRGRIDPSLHAGMGDWVAGCDVCQEVCPYNASPDESPGVLAAYAPRAWAPAPPLIELLRWTPQQRGAALEASALKRIKPEMLRRNAAIAAGNALLRPPPGLAPEDLMELRRELERLVGDATEPALVREAASDALARVARSGQAPG